MTDRPRRKLIEVALPPAAINVASAREKSIKVGRPTSVHLWWVRRPLGACWRAPSPLLDGLAGRATTVTVTRNQIGKSLNVPDRWYLAIVEVDDDGAAEPIYLRRPFASGEAS